MDDHSFHSTMLHQHLTTRPMDIAITFRFCFQHGIVHTLHFTRHEKECLIDISANCAAASHLCHGPGNCSTVPIWISTRQVRSCRYKLQGAVLGLGSYTSIRRKRLSFERDKPSCYCGWSIGYSNDTESALQLCFCTT